MSRIDGHEEGNVTALTRTEEPDCGDPQTRLELLNVDKVAVKMSEKLILNVQRCFVLMCGQRTPIHASLRPLLTLSELFFYLLLV